MRTHSETESSDYEKNTIEKLANEHLFVIIIDFKVLGKIAEQVTQRKFNKEEIEICASMLDESIDYASIYNTLVNIIKIQNNENYAK